MLFWISYSLYFYGVNKLDNPSFSLQRLLIYTPSFAIIFYGVFGILRNHFSSGVTVRGITYLMLFYVGYAIVAAWITFILLYGTPLDLTSDALRSHTVSGFLQTVLVLLSNYSLLAVAYFLMRKSIANAMARQAEAEAKLAALQKLMQTEAEKQQYEYLSLAGQVSPHFMANLLNGWMGKLLQTHQHVANAMHKAYLLMLYYLDARTMGKMVVPATFEVQQVEAYLELMGQSANPVFVEWQSAGNAAGYAIPPTTLLTPIENAFKHGRSDLRDRPIHTRLDIHNNTLRFTCRNVVNAAADRESHGIGLANLRRRLALRYGSNFSLDTHHERDEFMLQLSIDFNT